MDAGLRPLPRLVERRRAKVDEVALVVEPGQRVGIRERLDLAELEVVREREGAQVRDQPEHRKGVLRALLPAGHAEKPEHAAMVDDRRRHLDPHVAAVLLDHSLPDEVRLELEVRPAQRNALAGHVAEEPAALVGIEDAALRQPVHAARVGEGERRLFLESVCAQVDDHPRGVEGPVEYPLDERHHLPAFDVRVQLLHQGREQGDAVVQLLDPLRELLVLLTEVGGDRLHALALVQRGGLARHGSRGVGRGRANPGRAGRRGRGATERTPEEEGDEHEGGGEGKRDLPLLRQETEDQVDQIRHRAAPSGIKERSCSSLDLATAGPRGHSLSTTFRDKHLRGNARGPVTPGLREGAAGFPK